MLQYDILPKHIRNVWGTAQFPPNTAMADINSASMQHRHATNSATETKTVIVGAEDKSVSQTSDGYASQCGGHTSS